MSGNEVRFGSGAGRRMRSAAIRGIAMLACAAAWIFAQAPDNRADAAPAASGKSVSVRVFSPQGEIASVRQARATFSDAMVDFGDPKLAAPFDVRCPAPGTGRWVDDRSWVYDFTADVAPGTRCSFDVKSALRSRDGGSVTGRTAFTFSTGGPAIVRNFPSAGEGGAGIDEEQVFVLVLNGPATPASVVANAWCEISGIGERVAVRLVDGADRVELLKRFGLQGRADNVTMLACARRLPNSAKVAIVWGRGIAAASAGVSGAATTTERRLNFEVRADFTASFGCERENAQAACTPVRPVRVDFTSPVARALAERFVLRFVDGGKTIEKHPSFDPDNHSASVSQIAFRPPFAENADLTIEAPKNLVDDAGRPLSNASLFPLKSKTALAPPLVKFAASPFGILELNADPVLPLTVRHVEAALAIKGIDVTGGAAQPSGKAQGMVRSVNVDAAQEDAAIVAWQRRIKRYHESTIPKSQVDPADLPPGMRAAAERERVGRHKRTPQQQAAVDAREENLVATRELSLLKRDAAARTLALPDARSGDPRPFEVVGIPLPEPGFHVVEIESQRLGAALLGKPAPMYVRTSALVTNLGVHAKFGRVNSGVWVTTLDRAKPVAGAAVQISDCLGKPFWSGTTDARGFALVARAFPPPDYTTCINRGDDAGDGGGENGYFVSARNPIADGPNAGKTDMAFVWSTWNEGIESWRFNLPGGSRYGGEGGGSDDAAAGRLIAHTVFDRTLLRAGQTVSMKHYLRTENLVSLSFPAPPALPTQVEITHVGSDQKYTFDLAWRGNRYADTVFKLPDDAKLGVYQVTLKRGDVGYDTGSFRVEEFRLPVMRGRIVVGAGGPDAKPTRDLVRPSSLSAAVSISYTNGGSASALPVRLSAAIKPSFPQFQAYDGYSFVRAEPSDDTGDASDDIVEDGPRYQRGEPGQRIVADKLAVTLDKDGAGKVELKDLPVIDTPRELRVEATYPDPNGEIQTLSQTVALWPSSVVVGVRTDNWVSVHGKAQVKLLALDTAGRPVAGVPLELHGMSRNVRSTRKRMVGGFYAYDNQVERKELGLLCSGKSNAQGLLFCAVSLAEPGNVELLADAKDAAGNVSQASASVWVTRQAEVWFGGENQDRIDVLPEKKAYAPGEIAKFQIRMPFRAATALVAIERDGIVATQVVEIRGDDPTVSIKVEGDWAPNVFVSVLAVRGRIRDVPWYSFFSWGWKSPTDWWHAWRDEGKLYEPPTAMVDLGKPAFKYGIAAIQVDKSAHQLKVAVTTDRPDYPVRATAKATVHVTQSDGKPAPAGTEVAVAAVDEALLELMPNESWDLFDAMIRQRSYGIETATAQMQIIGKRHYGRKAAPPGGGGGVGPTRELFDTLLLWKSSVVLDANGNATVDVPLNDSLTAFRIVAVADGGTALFGTGSATIRSRQDLQIVSGLPPLVREGDRYQAGITLRNTTKTAMEVEVGAALTLSSSEARAKAPAATPLVAGSDHVVKLASQRVQLAPDASQLVEWPVTAPYGIRSIDWRVDAKATAASDSLTISQRVAEAIPISVQQATLTQLDRSFTLPVAAPADAMADANGVVRGGLSVAFKAKLADGLPGVSEWFRTYPYACLEQKASIAIGTLDEAKWNEVARQIPLYLDNDGLASYFPPRADDVASGSDVLTAYLLTASAEASALGRYAIPDVTRARMQSGLVAFVEGRIKRDLWSPFSSDAQRQLDVRKLSAIEALTRDNKATPRMLQSIQVLPNQWPTSAVIDWMLIVRRLTGVPDRNARLAEADQILRSRLNYQGTRLDFSTEKDDFWYWLMASGDGNASRLLLAVMQDPAWKDDVPRLVVGSLQRQSRGHWLTTTANAWGMLAVNAFSKRFERDPVTGTSRAAIAGVRPQTLSWADNPQGGSLMLAWPMGDVAAKDASATVRRDLQVTQDGNGKPWLTVQSLAAVPLKVPFTSGYRITRTITPVEQKVQGVYSRGDVLRIHLDIDAQTDMSWVVVSDPIPGGASVLGTGLGRDSQLAASGEQRQGWTWPAYEEKSFETYRSYYRFVPKGKFSTEYTVRLNNVGTFGLPPTRVEAMYAPEMFGAVPNATVEVQP
ncbi:MAG: MG2 domain-containing protein [Burkholderiaceae bacterium]